MTILYSAKAQIEFACGWLLMQFQDESIDLTTYNVLLITKSLCSIVIKCKLFSSTDSKFYP